LPSDGRGVMLLQAADPRESLVDFWLDYESGETVQGALTCSFRLPNTGLGS
jgi:hypothetical protein